MARVQHSAVCLSVQCFLDHQNPCEQAGCVDVPSLMATPSANKVGIYNVWCTDSDGDLQRLGAHHLQGGEGRGYFAMQGNEPWWGWLGVCFLFLFSHCISSYMYYFSSVTNVTFLKCL